MMQRLQHFRFGCGCWSHLDLDELRIHTFPHEPLYWSWQKIKCRKQGREILVQTHEDHPLIYSLFGDVQCPCCTSGKLICLVWWNSGNKWMYLFCSRPLDVSAVCQSKRGLEQTRSAGSCYRWKLTKANLNNNPKGFYYQTGRTQ